MTEFLVLLVLFQLRHMIVIAYLHRDLCHKSIVFGPKMAQFTRILQWMQSNGKYDPQWNLDWAYTHKKHHKHSDTKDDPYWPIVELKKDPNQCNSKDIFEPTRIDQFLMKYPWGFPVTALVFSLFYSWLGVVFAIAVWWTPRWRMIWANYVYHRWPGYAWQPVGKIRSAARNLYWGPLVFMGEELHANHHQWPGRANFGIKWWEVDISYWFFRLLSVFRLVEIKQRDYLIGDLKLMKVI